MNNNDKRPVRVKGLANIGALINRADLPQAPTPAARRERRDLDQIFERTNAKIVASIEGNERCSATAILGHYLLAAIREAYNTGHADALDQNSAVDDLLEKQYEARTRLTMPTVVAAVMEQHGMSELTLDLTKVATVFERVKVDYTITEQETAEYTLHHIEG